MRRGFRFEENGGCSLSCIDCVLIGPVGSFLEDHLVASLITERWSSGQRLKGCGGNCTKRTCSASQQEGLDG